MAEHKGLPVAGYVPQSEGKVALVNENKILEERVLRQIDAMQVHSESVETATGTPGFDEVMMYEARMRIQEGFMWLNRAVFRPTRVRLPEDNKE